MAWQARRMTQGWRDGHGSSILSEVDKTSISGRGAQTRQRCPLSWLPVSRFLPPRSGLERSDFVRCGGFRMPACTNYPRAPTTGVRKAPRHEVAGGFAPAAQRVL